MNPLWESVLIEKVNISCVSLPSRYPIAASWTRKPKIPTPPTQAPADRSMSCQSKRLWQISYPSSLDRVLDSLSLLCLSGTGLGQRPHYCRTHACILYFPFLTVLRLHRGCLEIQPVLFRFSLTRFTAKFSICCLAKLILAPGGKTGFRS